MLGGLTSNRADSGRHGAGGTSSHSCGVAGGKLKMARNLTSACTRPATRCLSCFAGDAGGRVMRGVRLLYLLEV
jgi:hypothetical protein